MAYELRVHGQEEEVTVRVSIHEDPEGLTLKIEGRVVGEWASELERFWELFHPLVGTKQLWLDICGVIFLDRRGRQILQKISAATGAEILANSPLTRQFAEEVKQIPNEEGLGEVYE